MINAGFYDYGSLYENIIETIIRLGGEVEVVDPIRKVFNIEIDCELKEVIKKEVEKVIDVHIKRKIKDFDMDPFFGVKHFVNDIQGIGD